MTAEWSRYWRSADLPVEAMHAHFERHAYHRHSHDTYSFGVTDDGVQAFRCRGASHASVAGMVMAFNPDDPHDGHPADPTGFTYRMVHIGPDLVAAVLAGIAERPAALPLFTEPVVDDPALAGAVRALHRALAGGAPALRRDELLTAAVASAVRRVASPSRWSVRPTPRAAGVAERARAALHDRYLDEVTADDLAELSGCSRFTVYRAFRSEYGMAPSDYQRLLRLRAARRLIGQGRPIGEVAAQAGFADQAHLTRWFRRCYGLTPGGYQRAVLG